MILKGLTLEEFVVWDEDIYPTILPDMIERFGKGPFKVVGLNLHRPGVRRVENSSKGAPYLITIELANGERKAFAGEWFSRTS